MLDPIVLQTDQRLVDCARIAHTFHMDPLVVLHGYRGAEQLEHDEFGEAFNVRRAAHNVVCADLAAQHDKTK